MTKRIENISKTKIAQVRIGTRGSDLALWQARHIQDRLSHLGVNSELEIIKTKGDKIDNVPLSKLEGKNFFTKELEEAQLSGRVDFAVHSMKDLATEMPAGLTVAAMVGREDARELLLIRPDGLDKDREARGELLPLADGASIGTSAARRQAQLRDLRPDLEILDLRGNVPTRVGRLRENRYDAILIALAGVTRLKLDLADLIARPLPIEAFVPAPAQGMLAIQCRDEAPLVQLLRQLNDDEAAGDVLAERKLLAKLNGGCQLPFGVNVRPSGAGRRMDLFWQDREGSDKPLRLHVGGTNPDRLIELAFHRISSWPLEDECD
jgi:hydroxymethylbilane synthase